MLLAVTSIVQCGEANEKKNEIQGIFSSNIGNGFGGKYENYNTQDFGSLKNNEGFSNAQTGFEQQLSNNYQGSLGGAGTNFRSGAGNRATVSTITQTVGVLVPQPYRVTVNRPVPVQVPQPVAVYVPRAVKVPVPVPRSVFVPRLVPYFVSRAVPVPVQVPVQVPVPQPVGVIVPQPYTVTVPRPYIVRVPQKFVIPVAQPIVVRNGASAKNAGLVGEIKNGYGARLLNGFGRGTENSGFRNEVENNGFRKDLLVSQQYTATVPQSYSTRTPQKFVISVPDQQVPSGNEATGAYEVRGANFGSGFRNGNGAAIGNVVGKESENNGFGTGIQNSISNSHLVFQNIGGKPREDVRHNLPLENTLYYKGTSSAEGEQKNLLNGNLSYRGGSSLESENSFFSNVNDLLRHGFSLEKILSYKGTSSLEGEQKNSLNENLSYRSSSSLGSGQGFFSGSISSNENNNNFSPNANDLSGYGFASENDQSYKGTNSLEDEQRNSINKNSFYRGGNSLGSEHGFVSSSISSNGDRNGFSSDVGGFSHRASDSLSGKNEESLLSDSSVGQRSASSYSSVSNEKNDKK